MPAGRSNTGVQDCCVHAVLQVNNLYRIAYFFKDELLARVASSDKDNDSSLQDMPP